MSGLRHGIPWTRFWIPRETAPALDVHGYLSDPEGAYRTITNPHAKTLEELEDKPCVALLGEPGSGKSYVVDAYVLGLRADAGATLLHVDCRWHHDLKEEIFGTTSFKEWIAGRSPLTLVIDSLDEHPEGAYSVAAQLIGNIRRGPVESLRLRIACRTAEWPSVLDEQLPQVWKTREAEPQAVFYTLAPLRQRDVEMAAGDDAVGFLGEVARVNAEPLAIKPSTLGPLIEEHRHQKLHRTRAELYEDACRTLCQETSTTREGARRMGMLQPQQRLAIASRIAAVCILGGYGVVYHGVDRGVVPSNAVKLAELEGGTEPSAVGDVSVTTEAVEEVLKISALFAPRGPGAVGWAHQTYAEFLAARFLCQHRLSPAELLREMSNDTMNRTVPALRATAAWLASMNK